MNSSFFSRILSDNDDDAALLDAWLAERNADLALRQMQNDPVPFMVDAERLGKAAPPHDNVVESGQIRILSPKFINDEIAIPYVAVLDRWLEDMWLIAPFSPYSYPASVGEMTTGDRLVGRRVIQCWNARTAHDSLVAQSYVAGTLDESVRNDALALFRHVIAGTDLPESFKALVGPPILAKVDPRRKYLAESVNRYAPLAVAVRETEAALAREERFAAFKTSFAARLTASPDMFESFLCTPAYGMPFSGLAAEDRQPETTETFRVPELNVEIDIDHSPTEGKVHLVAYRNGKRDPDALKDFMVFDKRGTPVGVFEMGILTAESDRLVGGFLLVSSETNRPTALEPVSR